MEGLYFVDIMHLPFKQVYDTTSFLFMSSQALPNISESTSKVHVFVPPQIPLTLGQASKLQMASDVSSDAECVQFAVKK